MMPRLSVVTPYRTSFTLPHFLAGLATQDVDPRLVEVVLVEDGPSDARRHLVLRPLPFPTTVTTLVRGGEGHGAGVARNAGVEASRGEIVLFVDSDCILAPDTLGRHLRHYAEHTDVAFVTGAIREIRAFDWHLLASASFADLVGRSMPDEREPTGPSRWSWMYSGHLSVRRSTFDMVGGFVTTGRRCHDIELGLRFHKSEVAGWHDTACCALHIEHPRTRQYRALQLAGYEEMIRIAPEFESVLRERVEVIRRRADDEWRIASDRFERLLQRLQLPGERRDTLLVMPPTFPLAALREVLRPWPAYSCRTEEGTVVQVRMHRNCWDFGFLVQKSELAVHGIVE